MADATPAPSAAPASPSVRVLVIDDSNTIRRSAEIFLRQGGHEVVLAEDGFDALAKVIELAPKRPKDHLMVMNLCGRGDKDIFAVAEHLGVKL